MSIPLFCQVCSALMILANRLRALGLPVVESYPGAAQDIMGIPRKGAGEELLKFGLADFGLTGAFTSQPVKHDELDAITSAVVGSFFLAGKYEALKAPEEGALIIPDLNAQSGPLVVGLSGRIGSGKTTAARFIEKHGFAYVRFSQVIDDIILADGRAPDRKTRQEVGWRVSVECGQRWLCETVAERVSKASRIVVDGLRFSEDHAFFVEAYSARFIHVHLQTSIDLRMSRLETIGVSSADFLASEDQPTEAAVDKLGDLAEFELSNDSSLVDLEERIFQIVQELNREGVIEVL